MPPPRIPIPSVFFLSLLLLLGGCISSKGGFGLGEAKLKDGALHHVVLCWLREPGNAAHQERIIEATKAFGQIPGVLDVRAGKSVASERSIVDDSFDVGILIVLESKDALSSYLEHPTHDRAKKEILLPLIERLVVYDFGQ